MPCHKRIFKIMHQALTPYLVQRPDCLTLCAFWKSSKLVPQDGDCARISPRVFRTSPAQDLLNLLRPPMGPGLSSQLL